MGFTVNREVRTSKIAPKNTSGNLEIDKLLFELNVGNANC
jgi:hypothetical protein